MNLSELKVLMGIAEEDTSRDAILSLYLESALKAAEAYANAHDWSSGVLPGAIKLGIVRWVELSQDRKSKAGIASQSMAGMSVTYKDNSTDYDYFREAYSLWHPFRSKGVVFRPARRKSIAPRGKLIEIYDEGSEVIRIMTGNPEKL